MPFQESPRKRVVTYLCTRSRCVCTQRVFNKSPPRVYHDSGVSTSQSVARRPFARRCHFKVKERMTRRCVTASEAVAREIPGAAFSFVPCRDKTKAPYSPADGKPGRTNFALKVCRLDWCLHGSRSEPARGDAGCCLHGVAEKIRLLTSSNMIAWKNK